MSKQCKHRWTKQIFSTSNNSFGERKGRKNEAQYIKCCLVVGVGGEMLYNKFKRKEKRIENAPRERVEKKWRSKKLQQQEKQAHA